MSRRTSPAGSASATSSRLCEFSIAHYGGATGRLGRHRPAEEIDKRPHLRTSCGSPQQNRTTSARVDRYERPFRMTSATAPPSADPAPSVKLRRELGKWDLTAIGVNQVIGSAVFILPSQIAALVGNWSPIAFVAVGFASLLISP
jgi:hypothetical protein